MPSSFSQVRLEDPTNRLGPNWMRLPTGAQVVHPNQSERLQLEALLAQRTPPGPQYADFVREIWARGFEVFLVGGSVRDVIAGGEVKDVDLATTMPLTCALPVVSSMYGQPSSLQPSASRNGHLRLGGTPYSGDPFIDLCVFKHSLVGTSEAVFSSDFARDVAHRDFACNSIYFEPISGALIDPTGFGIEDALNMTLRLVCDVETRSPVQLAQIGIRFFKFLGRGYAATDECHTFISQNLGSWLQAMKRSTRVQYIRTQVLSKHPLNKHEQKFREFHDRFVEFGAIDHWNEYIEPIRGDILP